MGAVLHLVGLHGCDYRDEDPSKAAAAVRDRHDARQQHHRLLHGKLNLVDQTIIQLNHRCIIFSLASCLLLRPRSLQQSSVIK